MATGAISSARCWKMLFGTISVSTRNRGENSRIA